MGRRFDHLPLIYPIAHKSALFAVPFIVFHGLEEVVVAAFVWAILAISLLPFVALREIGRLLGKGQLRALTFHRRPKAMATSGSP